MIDRWWLPPQRERWLWAPQRPDLDDFLGGDYLLKAFGVFTYSYERHYRMIVREHGQVVADEQVKNGELLTPADKKRVREESWPRVFREEGGIPTEIVTRSAWLWMHYLCVAGNTDAWTKIARAALEDEHAHDPKIEVTDRAIEELAKDLAAQLPRARAHLQMQWPPPGWVANGLMTDRAPNDNDLIVVLRDEDGMLAHASRAAQFLEGFGTFGKTTAEKTRTRGREQWAKIGGAVPVSANGGGKAWEVLRQWIPDDPADPRSHTFAMRLARVLWRDVVAARVLKMCQEPAGLVVMINDTVNQTYLRRGNHITPHFDVTGPRGKTLAKLSGELSAQAQFDPHLLERVQKSMGGITMHRTLRGVVSAVWERHMLNEQYPNQLEYEGGVEGFARAIGEKSHEGIENVRMALKAGQHIEGGWSKHETIHGLWTYRTAQTGRRSLHITVCDILCPNYVFKLRKTDRGRFLVPWVSLPESGAFIGSRSHHGPMASLQMEFVATLVRRRKEVKERGGILLTDGDWHRMADVVALDHSVVLPVVEHWTRDGDNHARCIERVSPGVYNLPDVDPFKDALAFIMQGAELSAHRERAARARLRGPRQKPAHGKAAA